MDPKPKAALVIIRDGELPSQKNDYPDKVAREKKNKLSIKGYKRIINGYKWRERKL